MNNCKCKHDGILCHGGEMKPLGNCASVWVPSDCEECKKKCLK